MSSSNSDNQFHGARERSPSCLPSGIKSSLEDDTSPLPLDFESAGRSSISNRSEAPKDIRENRKPEPIQPPFYVYREPSSDISHLVQPQSSGKRQQDGTHAPSSNRKSELRRKFSLLRKIKLHRKSISSRESDESHKQEIPVASSSTDSLSSTILGELGNNNMSPHGYHYIKPRSKSKDIKDFEHIIHAQTLTMDQSDEGTSVCNTEPSGNASFPTDRRSSEGHTDAIRAMKFSNDGKYLAAAGERCIIKIWSVIDRAHMEGDAPQHAESTLPLSPEKTDIKVFEDKPVQEFVGHTSDILDLSWSKTHFLLSSSMDNRVMLWHVSMKECLCVFQHTDFVTSVAFHPIDDRIFLSGSIDGKVSTWNIPDKQRVSCATLPDNAMATSVGFVNDGNIICAGTYDGRLFLYEAEDLKYISKITITKENSKKSQKITAIQPMPGSAENILVTSNDSHIRLINVTKGLLLRSYRGADNEASQIRASFSDDGRYVICGSDKSTVHIWCTGAPDPSSYYSLDEQQQEDDDDDDDEQPDTSPELSDVIRRMSSSSLDDRKGHRRLSTLFKDVDRQLKHLIPNHDWHFSAHEDMVTCAIFAPKGTRQWLALTGKDTIYNFTPISYARHSKQKRDSSSTASVTDVRVSPCLPRINEENHDQQEELLQRAQYDYSEGNIMVTACESGQLKVWRVESGVYGHKNDKQEVSSRSASISSKSSAIPRRSIDKVLK